MTLSINGIPADCNLAATSISVSNSCGMENPNLNHVSLFLAPIIFL